MMCKRRDVRRAQEVQDAAAEALVSACYAVCTDDLGKALHSLYDSTLNEPVPDKFNELMGRLQ